MGRDIKLWPSVSASDLVGDSHSTHSQQLEMAGFKRTSHDEEMEGEECKLGLCWKAPHAVHKLRAWKNPTVVGTRTDQK